MRGERAGLRWSSGQTPEGEIRDPKVALIETTDRWAFLQPPSCCLRVRSALLLATHSNPLLPSPTPETLRRGWFLLQLPSHREKSRQSSHWQSSHTDLAND